MGNVRPFRDTNILRFRSKSIGWNVADTGHSMCINIELYQETLKGRNILILLKKSVLGNTDINDESYRDVTTDFHNKNQL